MSRFYLTDPNLLKLNLDDKSFKVYHHCCANFNIKKFEPFIRLVSIADDLKIGMDQVKYAIKNLSFHKIDGLPLISMEHNGKWMEYDMPSHKYFLEKIGFTHLSSNMGYNKIKKIFKEREYKNDYKFNDLDQYQLEEKLTNMSKEEFLTYQKKDFKYGWIYERVRKHRETN